MTIVATFEQYFWPHTGKDLLLLLSHFWPTPLSHLQGAVILHHAKIMLGLE